MLQIFAVIFIIKKVISLAKERGIKPTKWAVWTGILYGFTVLFISLAVNVLAEMGTIGSQWVEFPESLLPSIASIGIGLLVCLIPMTILKSKAKLEDKKSDIFAEEILDSNELN